MATPSFNETVIARVAAGLYGLQLGNGTMQSVLNTADASANGLDTLINTVYNRDFASLSNANVAKLLVANLGISGAGQAPAEAFVTAQLDAAGPANEGTKIAELTNLFSGLTADPVYGAAASAFNAQIASAVAFANTPGSFDRSVTLGTAMSLTGNQDFMSGSPGADTITARVINGANTLQDEPPQLHQFTQWREIGHRRVRQVEKSQLAEVCQRTDV